MPVCFTIVGDSMVKNLERNIRMSGKSKCVSLSGAHMKRVTEKAVETSEEMGEGMIVIQGGGNGLLDTGPDDTVKMVVDAVKRVKNASKRIRVAVVSILQRPERAQQPEYERVRKEVNAKLHKAVLDLNCEVLSDTEDNGLSFINMDPVLDSELFARDGVHLNARGDARMANRLIRWIDASSKYLGMKGKKRVNREHL